MGALSFSVPECCVYDMSLVSDGFKAVWAAWAANGSSPGRQDVFVRTVFPTLGPVMQAPAAVTNGDSLDTGQAVGHGRPVRAAASTSPT